MTNSQIIVNQIYYLFILKTELRLTLSCASYLKMTKSIEKQEMG